MKKKWRGVDLGERDSWRKLVGIEEERGSCGWDVLYERRIHFKLQKGERKENLALSVN